MSSHEANFKVWRERVIYFAFGAFVMNGIWWAVDIYG